MSEETKRKMLFCSICDYAISKLERDRLNCRPDQVRCPRCHGCDYTQFYSYGSVTHIKRNEAWECGEIEGAPLPFPAEQKEPHD